LAQDGGVKAPGTQSVHKLRFTANLIFKGGNVPPKAMLGMGITTAGDLEIKVPGHLHSEPILLVGSPTIGYLYGVH
jgi:hypothetical protein